MEQLMNDVHFFRTPELMDTSLDVVKQMQKANEAEKLNRQPPKPRPMLDRESFLAACQILLRKEKPFDPNLVTISWITGKSHCSRKSISDLKPILLQNMLVPKVHYGNFLACRLVTEPIVISNLSVVVEDSSGDVEQVMLSNFLDDFEKSDGRLKPGTILLIKEPYMKFHSMQTERAIIRVDSPSDVIFVHETEKNLLELAGLLCWYRSEKLSFCELKNQGNELYRKSDFEGALTFYRRAFAVTGPNSEMKDIRRNMAAVFLALERYEEALDEAKKSMESEKSQKQEKSMLRIGKALYWLGRWQESFEQFELMLANFPKNVVAAEELKRAKTRLDESQTGCYDFCTLYDQELANQNQRIFDVADYVGPVKVAEIPGKGKGLIATKNVVKGTLLLGSKAYVLAVNRDLRDLNRMSKNMITMEANYSTQMRCISQAIQMLKRNPRTANHLYALWTGKDADRSEQIPEGVIDTARIERICSMNKFGAGQEMKMGEDASGNPEPILDLTAYTGIWLLPAFLNHSCVAKDSTIWRPDQKSLHAKDVESIHRLVAIADKLRESYGARTELRIQMFMPMSALGMLLAKDDPMAALGAFGEALESVKGYGMEIGMAPSVYHQMAKIYLRLGSEPKSKSAHKNLAKQVANEAFDLVRIANGVAKKELFLKMYPDFVGLLD